MGVMIACSPSSGSSLLRRLLNRHDDLFCGSETHLLCKEALYTRWAFAKYRLLMPSVLGLKDRAWVHFRGIILDEEYPISKSDIRTLIAGAQDFNSFLDVFFQKVLDGTTKSIWLEKTPSNALCAQLFLNTISNAKLIMVVRDPYDTVGSLVNRGMSVYNASCVYLLNTLHLLQLDSRPHTLTVAYEELVNNPRACLAQICTFLDVDADESIFDPPGVEKGVDHMRGWRYRETEQIGKGSINRFESLGEEEKEKIIRVLNYLILKQYPSRGIEYICQQLGYTYRSVSGDDITMRNALSKWLHRESLRRSVRMSYFNAFNPVFSIRDE